jgi:DNA-binding transcriptional regulator YdaS (Cro superfamily)
MAGPKHTGRPPTLEATPEVGDKIIALISDGCGQNYAAQLCGVDPTVVSEWVGKGRKKGAKACYANFTQRIKEAKASFISANLKEIRRHSAQSWQCSAWLLERCAGNNFASPEVQMRHKLEELTEAFDRLKAAAKALGISDGGNADEMQPSQD